MHAKTNAQAERRAFYDRIAGLHLTPLWEVLHALVPPAAGSPCAPALWSYARSASAPARIGHADQRGGGRAPRARPREPRAARPVVHHAVALRRAAADPARRNRAVAPPHAIGAALHRRRPGAYTAVDGERTTMHPGDFIITPSWTWHDHGNDGGEPVVWLDGLDIPLVRFFDAGFAENVPRSKCSRHAHRRRRAGALRCEHGCRSTPRRPTADVADLQLPVCADARSARAARARRGDRSPATASSCAT